MTPQENLAALVSRHDLTYTEAADRLGVSRRTLYSWLHGRHKIPPAVMVAAPRMLKAAKVTR